MQEMTVNNKDISEFGARLLSYSVGSTNAPVTTGTVRHSSFPMLLHTDYGTRRIAVTLVFRPTRNGDIFTRLHSLTQQKNMLDGILFGSVSELGLPDGYLYRCVLEGAGDEQTDGESLEVTYTFSGIRHLGQYDAGGMALFCYSTVPRTDCRIYITVGSSWPSGDDFVLAINRLGGGVTITVYDVSPGDAIDIDGIRKTVYKNGINIFSGTDIITFPFLQPGDNSYEQRNNPDVACTYFTKYYPTFV